MITDSIPGVVGLLGLMMLAALPAVLVGCVIGCWLANKAFRLTRAISAVIEQERLERMWRADRPTKGRRAA
jgi:hypothetical protein